MVRVMVRVRVRQGSCGSLKVLELFFQIFKAWKVLENRHGP